MTVRELAALIEARNISGSCMDGEIRGGFMSDIMSRAMAEGFSGMAWITHRADMNALAVAVMKDAACVIFPAGIEPEEAVIRRAETEKMPLMISEKPAFEIAGIMYLSEIRGREESINDVAQS